jgi:phospholipid/cholesterol/gamma-HCH transport system permease protein
MLDSSLAIVGSRFLGAVDELGRATLMVRSSLRWLFKTRVELRQAAIQCMRLGINSLSVTTLTSFFTGMVLALESGTTSKYIFNEPLYVGTVVGFAIVMELSPVLTAMVVAGRAGAAVAAEIGTMVVTEQVDALYTLGTDPIRYLVIPRYIAFIVMLPLLTVFADVSGTLGGLLVSTLKLDIPRPVYFDDIYTFMKPHHFVHGFLKSFVFAFVIATVSCYKGLNTRGGAEGVGRSTTAAVVISMVSVLLLDYFTTAVLLAFGI